MSTWTAAEEGGRLKWSGEMQNLNNMQMKALCHFVVLSGNLVKLILFLLWLASAPQLVRDREELLKFECIFG